MKKLEFLKTNEFLYYDQSNSGIDVYMIPNEKRNNYHITFATKYGSIETEFKTQGQKKYTKVPNGIAHFLEHMKFYQLDGSSVHDKLSSLGSYYNAATSFDFTYYLISGSQKFKEYLECLINYVQTPSFMEKNIKIERGVITEEIKMYEDDPYSQMEYKLFGMLFHKDHHKYDVAGKVEEIKTITAKDLNDCYNAFYQPKNMFIVITGNFKPEEAMAIINENQINKQFNNKKIYVKKEKEKKEVVESYQELHLNIEIPKVIVAYKIPIKDFKDISLPEIYICSQFLLKNKFGSSSVLNEKLLNNKLITNRIDYNRYRMGDYLIIDIQAETHYPHELTEIIKKEMTNLRISQKELNIRKKVAISSLITRFENISSLNYRILNQIISYNQVLLNEYEIINKINLNKMLETKKVLETDNKSIVIVLPKE